MSKHKKTREEKIISDLRRKLQLQNQASSLPVKSQENTYEFKKDVDKKTDLKVNSFIQKYQVNSSPVKTYYYLLHDLLKTGVLTLSIILIQFSLLFILKNHIFKLPGLNY